MQGKCRCKEEEYKDEFGPDQESQYDLPPGGFVEVKNIVVQGMPGPPEQQEYQYTEDIKAASYPEGAEQPLFPEMNSFRVHR